jgi:NADH dehydrogenase FAD-containing subunit
VFLPTEEKTAHAAETDAHIAVHNIMHPNNPILKPDHLPRTMCVSLGSSYAIMIMGETVFFGLPWIVMKNAIERAKLRVYAGSRWLTRVWNAVEYFGMKACQYM